MTRAFTFRETCAGLAPTGYLSYVSLLRSAAGGVRFHRAGCPVLNAHTVTPYNPRIHLDAIPCDLCNAE